MPKLFVLSFILLIFTPACSVKREVNKAPSEWIQGYVDPRFSEVKEVFLENFLERGEQGAAVAVYYRGKKVVDLWGGCKDIIKHTPWQEHSMVPVYSSTKGMAAMAFVKAHSEGWVNFNEPVAKYWPEFAANGKDSITVRQLLAHEAGLCLVEPVFDVELLLDLDSLGQLLAVQEPVWQPGEKHGYHLSTLGLYMNELFRHIDPEGRTIGNYFDQCIAKPLDLKFYIGLPPEINQDEVVKIIYPGMWDGITGYWKLPKGTRKKLRDKTSLLYKSFKIPKRFNPNDSLSRVVENPSGNGIGTARAMAKAYSVMAHGGKALGIRPETFQFLCDSAITPRCGPEDVVMGIDTWYKLGYLKPGPNLDYGSSRKAFGTPGAGGSFAFADPDKQLGFAYVMSRMGVALKDDPREVALRKAVYDAIEIIEAKERAISEKTL